MCGVVVDFSRGESQIATYPFFILCGSLKMVDLFFAETDVG